MMGHQQAVNVLLSSEHTDVNVNEKVDGGTAFSIASEKSHFNVLKVLTKIGRSDEGKGWCLDNWANPCMAEAANDVPQTMASTTVSLTSGNSSKVAFVLIICSLNHSPIFQNHRRLG